MWLAGMTAHKNAAGPEPRRLMFGSEASDQRIQFHLLVKLE
jgi:hypothetical protein